MEIGKNFPVSEYYRENILDAITFSKRGNWWSAALLIEDPRTHSSFIGIYKWQNTTEGWKTRNRITIRSKAEAIKMMDVIRELACELT